MELKEKKCSGIIQENIVGIITDRMYIYHRVSGPCQGDSDPDPTHEKSPDPDMKPT